MNMPHDPSISYFLCRGLNMVPKDKMERSFASTITECLTDVGRGKGLKTCEKI